MCQSGRSAETAELAGAAIDFVGAGLGLDTGAAAGRALATGGAEGAVEAPEPPGRKASMRNKVIAKPVCSSGASDKSGRLVIVI